MRALVQRNATVRVDDGRTKGGLGVEAVDLGRDVEDAFCTQEERVRNAPGSGHPQVLMQHGVRSPRAEGKVASSTLGVDSQGDRDPFDERGMRAT